MNRWRFIAIVGYIMPLGFAAFIGLFTKWGRDVENCIFAFFVGVVVQCIIGVCGLTKLRDREDMKKERKFFWICFLPFIFIFLLFLLSGGYA